MNAVKITLAGRERYLAFTGAAMFDLREKYGGAVQNLVDAIKPDTREALAAAAEAAAILAEQGELVRRYMGHTPADTVTPEAIAATVAPLEIAPLKMAVVSAIELGYGRAIRPENDEVDLGLAELQAQKKTS
ncbi:MAG: hypothetical protein DBX59_01845 [Bacillota bacterium]|nr:MAG: hypothetical protein DBX59_01845 [Bacillota bacterium]